MESYGYQEKLFKIAFACGHEETKGISEWNFFEGIFLPLVGQGMRRGDRVVILFRAHTGEGIMYGKRR